MVQTVALQTLERLTKGFHKCGIRYSLALVYVFEKTRCKRRERSRVRSPTMAQAKYMKENFNFEQSKTPESFSQEDIHAVFELHPELQNIGSEEKYSKYLETVFPNSKYKEIGFKGVSNSFQEEDKPSFYTKDINASRYYSQLREGTRIISAIFDFQNPLIVNAERPAPITIIDSVGNILGSFNDQDINEKIISAGYDGLILNRGFSTPLNGWEILSFSNDSRQILGTLKDIQNFKEFIESNNS